MATRTILHCDLNCFFASVELLSHPQLRDKPVAVCGDPEERHGIVLAKNEPAKRMGVQTAETIWQAKRKCPELICLPPHHDLYRVYSQKVNAIYNQYTDLVEPFGIDESWLDITGSMHLFGGDGKAIADEIRARVKKELGLTLSVGVSFNKVFAKLGSDYKKPDATTVISPENWQELLYPLPVSDLLFVGSSAAAVLAQYGVRTIGDLARFPLHSLENLLGKHGQTLHRYACGLDDDPVLGPGQREPVKSVGNGSTFRENITNRAQAKTQLSILSEQVAIRLRQQGLRCGGVQITVRDANFKTFTRQKQLPSSTFLMHDIAAAALELLDACWRFPQPIRMLTVTAIHLTDEADAYVQTDLFGGGDTRRKEKLEHLELAMDGIRQRFGKDAISYLSHLDKKKNRNEEE